MTKKPKTTSIDTRDRHDGQEDLYALIRSIKDDFAAQLAEQIKINRQLAEQTDRRLAEQTKELNGIRGQLEDMEEVFHIQVEPIVWHSIAELIAPSRRHSEAFAPQDSEYELQLKPEACSYAASPTAETSQVTDGQKLSMMCSHMIDSWRISGNYGVAKFGVQRVIINVSFLIEWLDHTVAYLSLPSDGITYRGSHEIVLFIGFADLTKKECKQIMNDIARALCRLFVTGVVVCKAESLPAEADKDNRLKCLRDLTKES